MPTQAGLLSLSQRLCRGPAGREFARGLAQGRRFPPSRPLAIKTHPAILHQDPTRLPKDAAVVQNKKTGQGTLDQLFAEASDEPLAAENFHRGAGFVDALIALVPVQLQIAAEQMVDDLPLGAAR